MRDDVLTKITQCKCGIYKFLSEVNMAIQMNEKQL